MADWQDEDWDWQDELENGPFEEPSGDSAPMKSTCCIHGAKSTRVVTPRSPKHRETLTRETAALEGWAYCTVKSGPETRTVVHSFGGPPLGATHMHLDIYG